MLDTLFGFLLEFPPVVSVTIFSSLVLVLINVFYKILINQQDAKIVKERIKEINKQASEARKANNINKANELMSEALKENSKIFKMTMKPMIVSLVIVIVFLPWLHTHYGDVTGEIKNDAGIFNVGGINHTFTSINDTLEIDGTAPYDGICDGKCYVIGNVSYEASIEKPGLLNLFAPEKAKLGPIVATFPLPVPLFGYTIGWLGWYIMVSIPLVMTLRKLMKIHV